MIIMILPVSIIAALLLDYYFGEPRQLHPLVGFGKLANHLEKHLNIAYEPIHVSTRSPQSKQHRFKQVIMGSLSVITLISPFALLLIIFEQFISSHLSILLNIIILYWAIGHQSLREHVHRILEPCLAGDLDASRHHLSMVVSRNTEQLDQQQVIQATIETVLENGSDAIFAPLFWFFLLEVTLNLGAVAVVIYRLSNTLDAMWGYRSQRFNYFGRFAARLDDVLNYLPARLVSLSYAILGNTRLAIDCWQKQSPMLNSPNAGPVMAAGAGSLNVRLGGPTYYYGTYTQKPYFGSQKAVQVNDIERSLTLIRSTIIFWCFAMLIISIALWAF